MQTYGNFPVTVTVKIRISPGHTRESVEHNSVTLSLYEPGRAARRRGHWRTSTDARPRVPAGLKVPKRDRKVIGITYEPPSVWRPAIRRLGGARTG
jgi:hypothetical protein